MSGLRRLGLQLLQRSQQGGWPTNGCSGLGRQATGSVQNLAWRWPFSTSAEHHGLLSEITQQLQHHSPLAHPNSTQHAPPAQLISPHVRHFSSCSRLSLARANTSTWPTPLLHNPAHTSQVRSITSQVDKQRDAFHRMASLGQISDPYTDEKVAPLHWTDVGRPSWARKVKSRFSLWVQKWFGLGWCWANIPDFNYIKLYHEFAELYRKVSEGIATGQLEAIRDLVTPQQYTRLQLEATTRKQAGWDKLAWSMPEPPNTYGGSSGKVQILQVNMAAVDKELSPAFVQITVEFRSKQAFAAYNYKGQLMAGEPDKAADVVDRWVFERKAVSRKAAGGVKHNPLGAAWRVAGRLQEIGGRKRRSREEESLWDAVMNKPRGKGKAKARE